MKLSRVYCRTADGEERVYMGFQSSVDNLFDRHNPQLNHLMELLQFFQVTPSELFKAYEEDDHVQLGNIPNEISSEDILSAFSIHMEENSISKSELARRMGVDKSYLSSLFSLRYTSNLTMYTIRRIANALEIKLSHIFSIAENFKDSI